MTPLPPAVLFDMDGLLVETESLWFEAERTVVTELGGAWGADDAALMVGGPIHRAVAHMIEVSGGGHDELQVADRLLAVMEQLVRHEPIHWRPGARALLTELHERGVPCALVSASWRSLVDGVLAAVSADIGPAVFATTVAGDDLPRTKPHPDPYLEAARRLDVPTRQCVVLEDSTTGVQAAVASGACVVMVPSVAAPPPPAEVRVVTSLAELTPARLGRWSARWAMRQPTPS